MEIVCYGMMKTNINSSDFIFYFGGESGTAKPTEYLGYTVGVGSLFLELNTKDTYYFDGTTWKKAGA